MMDRKGASAPDTVIFGCGNTICGDDGFGPAVIKALRETACFPENVACVDAGTGIREYLFDYILAVDQRPRHIIIVDSVDMEGRRPGEVFTMDPSSIPGNKSHDFSLHQFPTVNMLHELQEHTDVVVSIVAARISAPVESLFQGLSQVLEQAVPKACALVEELVARNRHENT